MATQGTVANPTNNPVLAQGASLSQSVVDWSTALSNSALNIVGVLDAWNKAKQNPVVETPVTVNQTPQENLDSKLQKGFFYAGVAMVLIAGGIFLYKRV